MNSDLPYYVALAAAPGIGPIRFQLLIKYFKTAKAVWTASEKILEKALSPRVFQQFNNYRKSFDIAKYMDNIGKLNIKVITLNDHNYPKLLREISDAPPVLYIKGELPQEEKRIIGVVGTRKMTSYGEQVTEILVRDLVAVGFVIVSGLARGVDSYAHRVTIGNRGETIAVLGGGIDRIYPSENTRLAQEISDSYGAIVSEFPLGMQPVPGNFPARNRIISGLSVGLLVTEAGDYSGSLITAGLAGEQSREVFAVPGPIYSKFSAGPAELIKQGAKLVTNVNDILEELNLESGIKNLESANVEGDTEEEQIILNLMKDGPAHVDDITRNSGLEAAKVGATLSLMELKGKIKSLGTGTYSLNI